MARAMGADILIVSDVSFPLQPRERLDSAAVHLQSDAGDPGTQGLRTGKGKPLDRRIFLIVPALGTTPATDFTAAAGSSIAQGEAAARAVEATAGGAAVGEDAYRAYVARRAVRQPGLPPDQVRARRSGIQAL